PGAVSGEGEGAVSAGRGRLSLEHRLAVVDVGDGQGAAGGQVAGAVDGSVFGDRAGGRAADHGYIVRALDGDRDTRRGPIGALDGEGLGQRLIGTQGLDRRIAVGGYVSPG